MHVKFSKRVNIVVLCLAFILLFLMSWGNVPIQASHSPSDMINSTSPTLNESSNSSVQKPGDANGDGDIDMGDVVKVERIILGRDAITPGADANLDGQVDMRDLVKIERIIFALD